MCCGCNTTIFDVCAVVQMLKFACLYLHALILVGFCVVAASESARMLDLKQGGGGKPTKKSPKRTPWVNSAIS